MKFLTAYAADGCGGDDGRN